MHCVECQSHENSYCHACTRLSMNVYYSQNQKERNDFNRALTFGQYTQLNDWLVSIVTRTPIMCICKFLLLFTTLLDIVVIILNAVKMQYFFNSFKTNNSCLSSFDKPTLVFEDCNSNYWSTKG